VHREHLDVFCAEVEDEYKAAGVQPLSLIKHILISQVRQSEVVVPRHDQFLEDLHVLGAHHSLRHVRHDVYEAILDRTVDALAAGELRVVPLEYLDAQVDQVDLMLVCICVQEVTHCFADEMNLLEVLVLSDQLVEWEVITKTEVGLDELDVRIIWVCSYEGERLGLAELLNLQRKLCLIFALWVGLLQLDVIELLELLDDRDEEATRVLVVRHHSEALG